MTTRYNKPGSALVLSVGFTLAALGANALALDLPKRKSGLWEVTSQREGKPMGMGPIQLCIDHSTDDLMQQRSEKTKLQCSAMDVKQQGGKISVHSVCKMDTTTTTMDAVFTGAFDSAYRGEVVTRFNPPLHGMSESRMTIDARWLSACKPGQKPGDVIMPNMGTINMNEMMNKKK